MAIADTITSMQNHTSNAYTMIGYGTDLTGINKNLENLSTSIFNAFLEALRNPDTLFTNLPKKTGTGANITLNDTANAPMRITLAPTELSQDSTPTPSSPQDIHTISGNNTISVKDGNNANGTDYSVDLGVPNLFTGTNKLHERYGLTTTTTGNRITINGSASNISYGSTYFNLNGTENANANYYDYDTRTSGTTLPAGTYRVSATNFSGSYETTGNINLRITYFTSSNPKPTLATIILNTDTTGTFTLTEETTVKIQLQVYVPSGTTVKMNQFAFDIELIKGSIQQRGSFNPIEYCKIGNYADRIFKNISTDEDYDNTKVEGAWYIKKNIGKVVLDGTQGTISTPSTNRFNIDNALQDYVRSVGNKTYMCNGYTAYNQTATNGDFNNLVTSVNYGFNFTSGNSNTIRFKDTRYTAIEDFQNSLASNPITIYYVLATPTYTQITGTLETQLENVYQKLLSYSGTTNISQVNNDLSFNMSVQAIER